MALIQSGGSVLSTLLGALQRRQSPLVDRFRNLADVVEDAREADRLRGTDAARTARADGARLLVDVEEAEDLVDEESQTPPTPLEVPSTTTLTPFGIEQQLLTGTQLDRLV